MIGDDNYCVEIHLFVGILYRVYAIITAIHHGGKRLFVGNHGASNGCMHGRNGCMAGMDAWQGWMKGIDQSDCEQ